MKQLTEPPDGIILTISRSMADPMFQDGRAAYWMRVAARPTQDKSLRHVYLCMGNKIRYRGFYAGCQATPEGFKTFDTGRTLDGRFWILINGPIERAPYKMPKQGFRGFRYTQELW